MKPAKRNSSAPAKLLPALLLVAIVAPFAATEYANAGHHHADAAAERVAGCIDGACGAPVTPFGHFQGSWRRWPHSRNTSIPMKRQGVSVREPFIPPVIEEGRTSPRTRSDRPLDPEDMGVGAGSSGFEPSVPGVNAENPFNNTVDESDMPATGGGFAPAVNDDSPFPSGGGDALAPDVPDPNVPNPIFGTGGFDEPAPAPSSGEDDALNLFDTSNYIPELPTQQVRSQGAIRSIKSRGVSLQSGMRFQTQAVAKSMPSPEITLPSIDAAVVPLAEQVNVDLVSFEDFETSSRSDQAPRRMAKLTPTQLTGSVEIQDLPESPLEEETTVLQAEQSAVEPIVESANPLRRGSAARRNATKPQSTNKVAKKKTIKASVTVTPKVNVVTVSPRSDSRTLSLAVASRSLRDTLRKNPLRR